MNDLQISPAAEADLDDIWDYVATDNPTAADRLIDSLSAQFEALAQFPGIGRRRDDIQPGSRSFAFGKYVIYYNMIGQSLVISRVLHGARDIKTIFSNGAE